MTEPPRPSGDLLPLVDVTATYLSAEPPEAVAELERALLVREGERHAALRAVAARRPTFVEAWARLGASALARGEEVEAFAFARTAYHRGLDRLRSNGWRGSGRVPWSHAPNRGILLAVHSLMETSAALGEVAEVERCRHFLLEMDPTDPLRVDDG